MTRGLVVLAGSIFDNVRQKCRPASSARSMPRAASWCGTSIPAIPASTAPLGPDQHYSLSSPNSWSTSAADEQLGMIYVPMGMGAVDQWGGQRPPTTEKFAAASLRSTARRERAWVFQTVHHDLWDMDVPAQPALVDLPIGGRDGAGAGPDDQDRQHLRARPSHRRAARSRSTSGRCRAARRRAIALSPTQPFSALTLMPRRASARLTCGARPCSTSSAAGSPFASCATTARSRRPRLQGTLVYPGNFGVMDWGGMADRPGRADRLRQPRLSGIRRQADRQDRPADEPAGGQPKRGLNPNTGAPFAAYLNPFLSTLGLPCQAPPWGYVAGIDLATGKIVWQHNNGTVRDKSPLPLPFKMGVPSLGGPMLTAGGVAFMSSALDYYVRAYDVSAAGQLWQARLPAGGQATPMSYQGRDGRQYVVVVAGGHGSLGTKAGRRRHRLCPAAAGLRVARSGPSPYVAPPAPHEHAPPAIGNRCGGDGGGGRVFFFFLCVVPYLVQLVCIYFAPIHFS